MHDSEDYHTGRAATYNRIASLIARGWTLSDLHDLCAQQQLDAEATADQRAAVAREKVDVG